MCFNNPEFSLTGGFRIFYAESSFEKKRKI